MSDQDSISMHALSSVINNTESVSGGCPFFATGSKSGTGRKMSIVAKNPEWQTSCSMVSDDVPYDDYLHLGKVLNAQFPLSWKYEKPVHDEHLFIIVHQSKQQEIYNIKK